MIYLVYFFALIGALVSLAAGLVFAGYCWAKWLAKQKRLMDARVDAQRRVQP